MPPKGGVALYRRRCSELQTCVAAPSGDAVGYRLSNSATSSNYAMPSFRGHKRGRMAAIYGPANQSCQYAWRIVQHGGIFPRSCEPACVPRTANGIAISRAYPSSAVPLTDESSDGRLHASWLKAHRPAGFCSLSFTLNLAMPESKCRPRTSHPYRSR